MGSIRREARRLRALQAALDLHKAGCGDPVRAILLSPFDAAELDWPDFRGVPIEADVTVNPDVVRIDCLKTTVEAAIEEFHAALKGTEDDLREAEARLEAKIEQIAAAKEDWWRVSSEPEWWKRLARRDPEVYRRFVQGKVSWQDRVRAEAAQFPDQEEPEPRQEPDEPRQEPDPGLEVLAWMDAWRDFEEELRSTKPNAEDILQRPGLPGWLVEELQAKALRFYDQDKESVLKPTRVRSDGILKRLFRLVMRKKGSSR